MIVNTVGLLHAKVLLVTLEQLLVLVSRQHKARQLLTAMLVGAPRIVEIVR